MSQAVPASSPINSGKFYPPQVDTPRFLTRERVLDRLLPHHGHRHPSLIIEAQVGQGKTTVIKQFLDRLGAASVWYQVGPEDADPAFFLQSIPAGLGTVLPQCPSAETARMLTAGEFTLLDLGKRIERLMRDLDSCLHQELYFVFDDLHYLTPHAASLAVLHALLAAAPPRLHFVLSSREPLPPGLWPHASHQRSLLRLGNRELALDQGEVADLFHQVLGLEVASATIQAVARTTDGWVMGALLLGLQLKKQPRGWPLTGPDAEELPDDREIPRYFRQEIFTLLEPRLQRPLLILSLLDMIPSELAVTLSGEAGIAADLDALARRNLFMRTFDPHARVFGLHHLFRQFLREKAQSELGANQVRQLLQQAGRYYLDRQDPAQAFRYLLRAGDYALIENSLQRHGISFLTSNQTATLAALLQEIPRPCLLRQGWSTFFLALARLDAAPAEALPLLNQALTIFVARQDPTGELLTLAQIISIHITTTGHYRAGEGLLGRAATLFFRVAETLDPAMTILVARSLAMGSCILLADIEEANKYAALALGLARQHGLVNFEAAMLLVMGYIEIFAGHTAPARLYLEQAAPFVHRPEVGAFNRLAIRMMLFNFLFHDGDFTNYFEQKEQLIAAIGNEMVAQSIAGPFCYVWEMDIAINRGRLSEALALADQALARQPPMSPHLVSQILQLKAVVLALRQPPEQALTALSIAEESHRLRELAGGRYFLTQNALLVGVVRCRCGRGAEGLALLAQGIADAQAMPTEYLEACGLLQRAAIHLRAGATELAATDTGRGLTLMRRNSYRHFWAWDPESMASVLALAVTRGIEPAYARTLAAERLALDLTAEGGAIPIMEIQALGGFTLRHQGRPLLAAEALTPVQRELLCLLLVAPEYKLPQESMQLHFWPESPEDTVKIKFDTLLSRLRKTLAEGLPADLAPHYLKREKGMVWLAHCRVDAREFITLVRQGLRHYRLQEFWQAGNAFALAHGLWQGEFAPGVGGDERIRVFREQLLRARAEMTLAWSELLVASGRLDQAIDLTETALPHDPFNDALYGLLYRLHGQRSAMRARRVVQRFTALLHSEGYSDHEIAELAARITSPATRLG